MSVPIPVIKLLSTASKSHSNSSQLTPRLKWAKVRMQCLNTTLAVKKKLQFKLKVSFTNRVLKTQNSATSCLASVFSHWFKQRKHDICNFGKLHRSAFPKPTFYLRDIQSVSNLQLNSTRLLGSTFQSTVELNYFSCMTQMRLWAHLTQTQTVPKETRIHMISKLITLTMTVRLYWSCIVCLPGSKLNVQISRGVQRYTFTNFLAHLDFS